MLAAHGTGISNYVSAVYIYAHISMPVQWYTIHTTYELTQSKIAISFYKNSKLSLFMTSQVLILVCRGWGRLYAYSDVFVLYSVYLECSKRPFQFHYWINYSSIYIFILLFCFCAVCVHRPGHEVCVHHKGLCQNIHTAVWTSFHTQDSVHQPHQRQPHPCLWRGSPQLSSKWLYFLFASPLFPTVVFCCCCVCVCACFLTRQLFVQLAGKVCPWHLTLSQASLPVAAVQHSELYHCSPALYCGTGSKTDLTPSVHTMLYS